MLEITQLQERVEALDGRQRTLLTLYMGDAHLACGGASNSGLVVYATFDNKVFHQLVNEVDGAVEEVIVVAGGQPGHYSSCHVVPLKKAVAAARHFVLRVDWLRL